MTARRSYAIEQRARTISALVSETYRDPRVVTRYVEVGLWASEELLVLEHVPERARLLDVGCGAGRTSIPLAEMGLQVTGIDLSGTMIGVARQQASFAGVSIGFQEMDVGDLCFENESFDAVLFSYNGIELLPGRAGKRRGLAEIYRVLRPDGVLIFSTHSLFAVNRFAWARMVNLLKVLVGNVLGVPMRAQEIGERFIDDPLEEVKYIQILPPASWIRMVRQTGFKVVQYNTRRRLEAGRPWTWTAAWEDGERFYVARKE